MQFTLKRPCADCPFRIDIEGYLRPERAREIIEGLLAHDWSSFGCHQTTEAVEDLETGLSDRECVSTTEQCAGSLILLLKIGQPNVATRIAIASEMLNLDQIDMGAPVADSAEAFIEHHAAFWRRKRRD